MSGHSIGINGYAKPMRDQRGTNSTQKSKEAAQYIADMALELRNLAKSNQLLTLQGLLEVAYYEAFSSATNIEIPEGEIEHLKVLSRASLG